MSKRKHRVGWFVSVGMTVLLGASLASAQSGSLEPPGSAVNGSGDPVATTQTQPSWDQTLPANDGAANGCNSTRFKCVMGGAAVLDKQTGLVWEQSPDTTRHVWEDKSSAPVDARRHCLRRGTGGQMGWRLPSVHELTSLVVPGNPAGTPDLPAGHPFSNGQSSGYWSASTNVEDPTFAWVVNFSNGNVFTFNKTGSGFVWCVRGGSPGPDAY